MFEGANIYLMNKIKCLNDIDFSCLNLLDELIWLEGLELRNKSAKLTNLASQKLKK